ncbi:serine hydrolase family protein [Candidatus Roizmanbacteria bacterium]|nr:serine hydrolase family protein [Candidatus Roizmanbacteria bacterium]
MKQAFIIHGWGANSESNWFPWLKRELEKNEWKVTVPNMPNTENPKMEEWIKYFEAVVARRGQRLKAGQGPATTILIGHSLGAPFILRYLEKNKASRVYLVAGFHKPLGFPATENFVNKPFDWEVIKSHCKKFIVINSDNDPYIPREIGKELAKKLGVQEIIEHGGSHLNAPGGFLEYPVLLNLIE